MATRVDVQDDLDYYSLDSLDNYMTWVRNSGGRVRFTDSTMNYPSTTQALFALIVMIIVLLFILVYCCWGTFSCARQDDAASAEDGTAGTQQQSQQGGGQMVIVPFSNMLYVGDPESRRIYQIPLDQDKPPAYTEVFSAGPPPPYTADTANETSNETPVVATTTPTAEPENRDALPDLPPSYEDCLSDPSPDSKNQATANASTQGESTNPEISTHPNTPTTHSSTLPELPPSTRSLNVSLPSSVSQNWRLEGIILRPANLPVLDRRGDDGDGDNPTTTPQNNSQAS